MVGNAIRVLLVKHSAAMRWGLGRLIAGEAPRMTLVGSARNGEEALRHAHRRPSVIVLDIDLDGVGGADLIAPLRQRSGARVLIHTGIGDRRLHEDALLCGAAGIVASDADAPTVLAAIAAVHAGGGWNAGPANVSARRSDAEIAAGAAPGIAFLSPAERRAVARLRGGRAQPPPTPAELVGLYNKLGLRNRRELARCAQRFGAALDD